MTKGERFIHNVRGHLNSITMNAELGKMYIEQGKAADSALVPLDRILQQGAACADELDSLYEYVAELERASPGASAAGS